MVPVARERSASAFDLHTLLRTRPASIVLLPRDSSIAVVWLAWSVLGMKIFAAYKVGKGAIRHKGFFLERGFVRGISSYSGFIFSSNRSYTVVASEIRAVSNSWSISNPQFADDKVSFIAAIYSCFSTCLYPSRTHRALFGGSSSIFGGLQRMVDVRSIPSA